MVGSGGRSVTPSIAAALLLALFTGDTASSAPLQAAGKVFQQANDGLVVMEAESFRTNTPAGGHTWDAVTTPTGFVGVSAMQANPNAGTGGSPRLDFRVLFVKTGTHYVWVRGRALTAPAIGNNDSCHIRLNGAAVTTCDNMTGWGDAWTWRKATDSGDASFTIPAVGVHTVNLLMREDGFIADRILITTNAAYNGVTNGGTMNGPAQSPQIDDMSPGAPGTLTATAGVAQVMLGWGAATNADTYTVLRSTTAGGPYGPVATGLMGLTYVDTAVTPDGGVRYYYRVVGVDTVFGAGPQSNEASAMPLPRPPRFEDSEEGLIDDKCNCASTGVIPPGGPWVVAGIALLLRRRKR